MELAAAPAMVIDALLNPERIEQGCARSVGGNACESPFERFPGFFVSDTSGPFSGCSIGAQLREITRTAVVNSTRNTRDGFLYSFDAIEETGFGSASG